MKRNHMLYIALSLVTATGTAIATKSLVHNTHKGLGNVVLGRPMIHDNVGYNSGTRLQAVYLQGEDQSGFATGKFWDPLNAEFCTYTDIGDAGTYCVGPSYHASWVTPDAGVAAMQTAAAIDPPPPIGNCAYDAGYFTDCTYKVPIAYIPAGETTSCAYAFASDGVSQIEEHIGALISPEPALIYYQVQVADPNNANLTVTQCNSRVAASGYNFYPVLGAWSQVLNPTPPPQTPVEVWPTLGGYVRAVRQVNL